MTRFRLWLGRTLITAGVSVLPPSTQKMMRSVFQLGELWITDAQDTFLAANRGEMVNVAFSVTTGNCGGDDR